jgi:cell division septum initiation protein DivIVA
MSSSSRDPSSLDADEAGRREFAKARKGFAPNEVRAHMLALANEIKRLQGIESQLTSKVDHLEERLSEQGSLDPSHLSRVLGDETVRVIDAAREAADEIRTRAEDNASRLVKEAQERVTKMNEDAAELRESSAREADELVGTARAKADEILADANRAATELSRDAEEDAASMREKASKVLAERTQAAEEEATRIRDAAQQAKSDADEYAARIRGAADDDAARIRRDAEEAASRIRAEAAAVADQRAIESGLVAEQEIEAARDRGREMIREAKDAREKMLRDLAERRKTGRQQLEALRAGRERLLDAFDAARSALDGATADLVVSLPEAREAADAAARSVDDDIDAAVAELEQEIVASRVGDDDPDDDADQVQSEATAELETVELIEIEVTDENADTGEIAIVADTADAAAGRDVEANDASADDEAFEPADDELSPQTGHLRLVASATAGEVAASASEDADADADDDLDFDDDDEPASQGADVEQLFARLRSAQPPGDETGVGNDDDIASQADATVIDLNPPSAAEPTDDLGVDGETDESDESDEVESDDEEGPGGEQSLLDERDRLLSSLEKSLTRRLKRVVTDQENSVLDRVRRDRKARSADDLLPSGTDALEVMVRSVRGDLTKAVEAGAEFLRTTSSDDGVPLAIDAILVELVAKLDEWVQAPLRTRLERIVKATDDRSHDRSELVEQLRASYREWRNDKLPELSGDVATLAFNRGVLESANPSAAMCWVVDHGGLPCADAEDNRLAGALAVGEQYPTGDLCPPAHPGCRCLLVPGSR